MKLTIIKEFQITALVTLFLALSFSQAQAQAGSSADTLRGEIRNAESGEPIPGATVLLEGINRGAAADNEGRFEFYNLQPGTYQIAVQAVGYVTLKQSIEHPHDGYLKLELRVAVFEVEDVIVTSSPVGRNIQYQPAQAYNIQQMQDRQASSIGEILDGEPGIAMRSFGPAPARPVIRGFDGDRLLVLENGERMGDLSNTAHDHSVVMDPLVPDRIEVVRGPASLLYGSSALGGVVNIITSDIPREWDSGSSGTAALEGATMNDALSGFGRYQYGGDNWAATGRLSYRGAGDLKTPEGRLPGTFIQNFDGAAGAGYRSENFNAGFSFSAIDHNYGLPEGIDDPDEEAEIKLDQQTLQGRAEWSGDRFFDRIELRLHGSRLFQQEIETGYEADGTADEDIELEFLQYAANATLTFRHKPVGFFDEGIIGVNSHIRGLEVGGDEIFTPGIDNRSLAFFTFHEIPLSSMARFQFGIRGETHSIETRPNIDFPDFDESRSSRALSGSVGLNLRPVPGLELGAQMARAHRFPILEELFADGVHFGAGVFERGNPDLKTETGHGSDLFIRWGNNRIRAELAGFYYRISDFVAFEPAGEVFVDDRDRTWDIFEYRAREAEMLGGEAQLSVSITNQLQVGATLDYVRGSRVDTNSPLPTMPPLRARFTTRYDAGSWWMGGSIRIVDEQTRVVAEELPTDGYMLIDLNTGIRFDANGSHRLSLRVDNLADTLYRDHLSRVDRTEFGSPMAGRNVRLSYRFTF